MQYVQISVPKELCDKLGLHLNQTITLRSSENMCELDTRVDDSNSNSSDGASDEHHKLLLSKPGVKGCSVDEEAKQSSLKKPDGTFQVIQVNPAGNIQQNTSTLNVKSSCQLKNSQSLCDDNDPKDHRSTSDDSDDEDMSTSGFQAESCVTPAMNDSDSGMNELNVEEMSQSSLKNPNVPQEVGVKGNEVISDGYPRYCETCHQSFTNQSLYAIHKNQCVKKPSKKVPYFRMCKVCHRSYYHKVSFQKHKPLCVTYNRRQLDVNQKNRLQPVSSSSLCELNASVIDTTASNSSGLKNSAEGSCISTVQAKTAKWIPCTSNFKNSQNFFIVKNK